MPAAYDTYGITLDAAPSIHEMSVGSGAAIGAGIEYWGNELVSLIDNIGNTMLGMGVRGIGGAVAATTGVNLLTARDGYIPDFRESGSQAPIVAPNVPQVPQVGFSLVQLKDIGTVKKDMGIYMDVSDVELGDLTPQVPFPQLAISQSRGQDGFSRSLSFHS